MAERGITRWDPFADLDLLARSPFRDLFQGQRPAWGGEGFAPAMDVTEDGESYHVTAELPGVKRDDITVEVHEGVLTIRGEKREEHTEEQDQRRYVERRYGTFHRAFTLPADADPDQVDAGFQDGVLKVSVRKAPEAKPRTVKVSG